MGAVKAPSAAAAAAAPLLLALLLAGALPHGAMAGARQLPSSADVQEGVSYTFLRFRIKGQLDAAGCSDLCSVEIGCIAWTWYGIGRLCFIGYDTGLLAPLPRADAISGRPARVFSPDDVDCVAGIESGVNLPSLRYRAARTATVGECAAACASTPSCLAFTWFRLRDLNCYLKFTLTGGRLPVPDAVTGFRGPCLAGQLRGAAGGGPSGGGEADAADAALTDQLQLVPAPAPVPAPVQLVPAPAPVPAPVQLVPQAVAAVPKPKPAAASAQQQPARGAVSGGASPLTIPNPNGPGAATPSSATVMAPGGPQAAAATSLPRARPAVAGPAAASGRRAVAAPPSGAAGGGAACRGLTLDGAIDSAVSDVGSYAKGVGDKRLVDFSKELGSRRGAVKATVKESLKGSPRGDAKALRQAVEGAVQANVPGALGGAVEVGGQAVSFPGLVWESVSGEPYVANNCF